MDLKILIIEDEPISQRVLKLNLERLGYSNIDAASDGITARQLIDNNRYDAIFTDINLTGDTGLSVIEHLRNQERDNMTDHILVVAITASFIDEELQELANKAGINKLVNKPYNMPDIEQTLIDAGLRKIGEKNANSN